MTQTDLSVATLTESLSAFARGLRFEDLPADAVARARTAIIDCIGCMLAGASTDPGRIASAWAQDEGGAPRATAVGFGYRTAPSLAALVNGTTGHALDYDDVSPPMIGHPSVPLVPAILAAAESAGSSGADILVAYVVGLDVEARLGRLMNPDHYAYGWHATSTYGALAAAAAAGRLLGLDDAQMRHALGIAASGAGGLRKNFGSMTKALHAGQAAQRGLSAALLAAKGFDADPDILDGQHGFLDTLRGQAAKPWDASMIRFAVDQPLEITESGVGIKQYACCGCSHTAIDVLTDLMRDEGFTGKDIERIDCGVNVLVPGVLIHKYAQTGFQGKFSMAYSVAVAALDGAAGPRQFEDERAAQADVQAMQQRVFMTVDPDIPVSHGVFPTRLKVTLKGGRTLAGASYKARGMHPDLPLSDAQVDAKFQACASYALAPDAAGQALALLRRLETLDGVAQLMPLLAGPGR
ncbi:MAG: MmgE/PrpD family protein [Pseudomonadota bacterium]